MIKNVKLKFGKNCEDTPLEIDIGSVTILVGPNNSGKSLALREIDILSRGETILETKIISNIDYNFPNETELKQNLEKYKIASSNSHYATYGKFNSTKGFMTFTDNPNNSNLINWLNNSTFNLNSKESFNKRYTSIYVSWLGGKERFSLIRDIESQDLKSPPNSNLCYLFINDQKRNEVRELIFEAFSKYFTIDLTSLRHFKIQLSDVKPPSNEIERGFSEESVDFHTKAKHISEFSDGVQAFTGLVMTVLAGEEKILLIDEPEAFLHPSLSNLLGKKLSELMSKRDGNLIVSTHNSNFVMGCLQSGIKMNIVRLTYDNFDPTARLLNSEKIIYLFKNPLLRSTGVLQALFHSSVIVTESDTDRAFYNEINERLFHNDKIDGIFNSLFLNAQNKQTIHYILEPLREMGIPSVGIVDIDIVKDGGSEFTKLLTAAKISSLLHQNFQNMREKVKRFLISTGKDMKRDGGILLLKSDELELAEKFISDLAEYGIFIVPNGELESWLKELKCSGHGPSWLIQIFSKIGLDSNQSDYLKPDEKDVWQFLRSIKKWIENPSRKGMN